MYSTLTLGDVTEATLFSEVHTKNWLNNKTDFNLLGSPHISLTIIKNGMQMLCNSKIKGGYG